MASEVRLEREEQIAQEAPKTSEPFMESASHELVGSNLEVSRLPKDAQELIQRMLDGTEDQGDDVKYYHVIKFGPQHVNVAILRAAGFKGTEIAQITGYGQQMVYQTMLHPYTKKLAHALVPQNSARVLDIRTKLDKYASTLMDEMYNKALVEEDLDKLAKVTFGLLDRAGHGPKQDTAAGRDPNKVGEVPAPGLMNQMLRALEGSSMVDTEMIPNFRSDPAPAVHDLVQGSESAEKPLAAAPRTDQGGTHLSSPSSPVRKVG